MRLINADELIEDIKVERVKNLYMEGLQGTPRSYEYLNQLQDKLEEAETVDAIPVDWILRYLLDHPINYFDSIKLYITQMIQDWRNENESNSNM